MNYLLSISIGPVQDFIATARRSRDLWFGSWLLSELSKAAAFAICEGKAGNLSRLIFPCIKSISDIDPRANSDLNVVNKIVALVDNPKVTSDAVDKAMQERLDEMRKDAYKRIPRGRFFDETKAIAQVKDMIELFWAAYPLEDEGKYAEARAKAELLLSARKATRDFRSCGEWASNAPKSALDGQRESVIDEGLYDLVKERKITKERLRVDYGLREGERLCGVGLLKRNGNRANDEGFFSTSHVATLPLLKRLEAKNKQTVKDYLDRITKLLDVIEKEKLQSFVGHVPKHLSHEVFQDYDGHLLFSERLREFFTDEEKLKEARNGLSDFLREAFNGERPLPYYALLLADGDNMGKVIDSITRVQIGDLKDIEKHRRLSEQLSEFATSVSSIIENKHDGSLIYAGGDDVLAFVPLHTVLQCSRELADEFREGLKDFAFKESGHDYQPTLSVGIVIAHHLEPLQDALTLVRQAERTAKKVEGKDALAIILSKRSGADTTINGSWQRKGSRNALDHRLLRFAQLHLAGEIPDGAAYELRDLYLRLNVDKKKPEYPILQEAMHKEAVRILARKQIEDKNVVKELTDDIESKQTSLGDLANELIIAREFAKALRQARREPTDLGADIAKAIGKEGHA